MKHLLLISFIGLTQAALAAGPPPYPVIIAPVVTLPAPLTTPTTSPSLTPSFPICPTPALVAPPVVAVPVHAARPAVVVPVRR